MTKALPFVALVFFGACWGATQTLTKVAVSTGYGPFGLLFWQGLIGAALLVLLIVATGRGLPFRGPALRMIVVISLIGAVIPNTMSYQAIAHIPAGVYSVMMSLVPMVSFPLALALSVERYAFRRLLGLLAGLAGVLILILPEASLPASVPVIWVLAVLIPVLCYGSEGNIVARWGTGGLDPVQLLCGASVVTALLALPLALGTGQFISPVTDWGAAEWAILGNAALHVTAYTGYVWLVSHAGPVFAVQISYIVTPVGVGIAMLTLGESYSGWFWVAMALVLLGLALVQPRPRGPLAPAHGLAQTSRRS